MRSTPHHMSESFTSRGLELPSLKLPKIGTVVKAAVAALGILGANELLKSMGPTDLEVMQMQEASQEALDAVDHESLYAQDGVETVSEKITSDINRCVEFNGKDFYINGAGSVVQMDESATISEASVVQNGVATGESFATCDNSTQL